MATLPIDSNIDLIKNEIQNFKIYNLSTAPSTAGWTGINLGWPYYNTTDKVLYIWNGTAFQSAGGAYVHPNHTGDVTSVADGATTIVADAVSNTKLANMAAGTLKGNNTGGSADPLDLTAAQVRTMLNVADGAQVNVSTNLALGTATATTQPVTNSNGTGFTLPIATTSLAGLLSAADKVKVDAAILSTTTDVSAASWAATSTSLGTSNAVVPTQNAVKAYVDNIVLTNGSLVYKGGYNASTNSPLLDATPIAGIKTGWTYVTTTAGVFFTTAVEPGDMIIALQDSPTLEAHWTVVNKNIPDVIAAVLTGFSSTTGTITSADTILSAINKLNGNDGLKAPLASPALTGTPTAPTPSTADNNTNIATTAFVKAQGYTTNTGTVTKTSTTFGNGVALTYAISHTQGADVIAQVRYVATNSVVLCETVITNSTTVTLNFNTAPATNSLRVTIIG